MTRRLLIFAVVALLGAGFSFASEKGKEGTWTGWVTDTHCGAKGANNPKHADCAKNCVDGMGAKYALYDPADKKVYVLEPQEKAASLAGQHVKVKGNAEGDTIKVTSIEATAEQKGHEHK